MTRVGAWIAMTAVARGPVPRQRLRLWLNGGMNQWHCISGCGACCRLDPALRGDALEALSVEQRTLYLSMVGADGWCVHFDSGGRRCRIYDQRPDFCRVENLVRLFGAGDEDADALAIACCTQQIRSESGGRGKVMRRFRRAIRVSASRLATAPTNAPDPGRAPRRRPRRLRSSRRRSP